MSPSTSTNGGHCFSLARGERLAATRGRHDRKPTAAAPVFINAALSVGRKPHNA